MKLRVFTPDGTSSVERDFPIAEFEGNKGVAALKQVLVAYMANKRQGTVNTLTSSTVHGTGKKPFRQKGTGGARQGSRTRVQHYHGAVSHGPHPRDYSQKIPKRVKRLALERAFYERVRDGEVDVIQCFEAAEPKTRVMNAVLANIDAKARKILIVDANWEDAVILSARNLARVYMTEASSINALDLSRYDRVVVSENGIKTILARLNGESAND